MKVLKVVIPVRKTNSTRNSAFIIHPEIVHYMCKQSLIYYLTSELDGKVEKEAIEAFVNIGENVSEYDAAALIKEELINKEPKSHKIRRHY